MAHTAWTPEAAEAQRHWYETKKFRAPLSRWRASS